MTVSIIIPLYNKAPQIQRALDSVLAQTLADFELIVVDDGSTDGGAEVVRRCLDPRVRLIVQPNAGPGQARNRGLVEAKSPYVAFLDADDQWLPSYLQKSVQRLEQAGPDVASTTCGYILQPGHTPTNALWRSRGLRQGTYRLQPRMHPQFAAHLLAYLSPCTTLARTDRLRQWGGFYGRDRALYGEDAYLWLKFLLNETVTLSLEPLAQFYTDASTLSGSWHRPRPVEPMLIHPEDLYAHCPRELENLLESILAIRAAKTACVLAYWGQWRQARALLNRFCPLSAWRLPHVPSAQLCATPVGAAAGTAWRLLQRRRATA